MLNRISSLFQQADARQGEEVTLRRMETTYAYLATFAYEADIHAFLGAMNNPSLKSKDIGLGFNLFRTLKEAQEYLGSQTRRVGLVNYVIEVKFSIERVDELLKFPKLDKAYKVASKNITLAEIRAAATEIRVGEESRLFYVEYKNDQLILDERFSYLHKM